jgi:predicted ATPase/DNA-binding SARP family transcriptional activator/Tfp pilus assembly protein PilF
VERDGREVTVSGLRRRALLVRLAVSANEVVPSGRLIEDLWDGSPPPGAASTLQSHVSVLRGLIGSDRIRFGDGGYQLLLQDGECDVRSMDELTEARRAQLAGDLDLAAMLFEQWLGRWRGGALADVAGAFWATGEVTRLEELRAGALEQWLGVRLGLGDHATVIADAERAVSDFSLREGFWATLMLAQYRSGRQSDALRTFRRLCTVLGDELGIEPSGELGDLEEAILLQKPELDWHPIVEVPDAAEDKVLPSGTVTFLATEIEGSTALLEQVGDDVFEGLVQGFRRVVRDALVAHHGFEVSTDDAGVFAVFAETGEALAMATVTQSALRAMDDAGLSVRVRMGMHTGPGRRVGDSYARLAVHQASLVCAAAQGGQIVATEATRVAAGGLPDEMWWLPLGRHRLPGLSVPLELHQLCHSELEEHFEPLRSVGVLTHHIPVQVSSFLGRVEELALGTKLLATNRVLSVVGAGGAGKTRVAYQLAEAQRSQFPDGVWVVELASEVDAQRIPALLLSGLGLRDEPGRTANETIVSHLRDRRALVVLDNCEHLVDAVASFAVELLGACGRLRVLVTSREALRIGGEAVWQLGPLQLPEVGETELGVIAGSDAVALFCERAGAAWPGFSLDAANVATVTRICRRVEGLPLAIELAAAWIRTVALPQIDDRLEQSLDLLSQGSRRGSDRHSSLRATLTWSHDLLAPTEQVLFRRLAVFSSSFTLTAAERVLPGDGLDVTEVLDALDGLVDKSLVDLRIDQDGQGRYWLLETVRAYAHERLVAAGEVAAYLDRHAQFYCSVAADCAAEGATGAVCDRLEADHPNLRAAIEHLAGSDRSSEHGRLVLDLSPFWELRGYWRLGEREFRRYLAREDRDWGLCAGCHRRAAAFSHRMGEYQEARTRHLEGIAAARRVGDRWEEGQNLAGLGSVAWFVAEYAESKARYEEALAIARELGDRRSEGRWLCNRGIVAQGLGEYLEARSDFEQSLVIAREFGDLSQEGSTLGNLGVLASDMGDYQQALGRYEEALAMFREIGDRSREAGFIGNIGRAKLRMGDYSESRSRFEEALALTRGLGDRQSEGYWLGSLGEVASQVGDYDEARRCCEEALAIAREVGDRRSLRDWLVDLGGIECKLGDYAAARARYLDALALARALGRPDDLLLEDVAEFFASLERYEQATELLGAADAITTRTRRQASVARQSRVDASLAACRTHQSDQTFALAYGRGHAADWAWASDRAWEYLGMDSPAR